MAVGLTAGAASLTGPRQALLLVGGVIAAIVAWGWFTRWQGWDAQQTTDASALLGGFTALLVAGTARTRRVSRRWLLPWGAGAAAMVGCAALYAESGGWVTDRGVTPTTWLVAGLAMSTVAMLAAAQPLDVDWLRDVAVGFALASLFVGLEVWQTTTTVQVAVLTAVSAACAVLTLLLPERRAPGWRRGTMELGVISAVAAAGLALSQLPDRGLLIPVLAVMALQSAAIGVVRRLLVAQVLAPLFACAAWLVYASEAFAGSAEWFTVPVGLAMLSVLTLWRRDRRRRDLSLATPPIVTLEVVGAAFLVGASFVQAVTVSLAYALIGMAVGAVVIAWGAVSQVRRRLVEGAVIDVGAVVLLVAVPLVDLLPGWQGAGLWLLIGAAGLVALLAATLLEQSRTAVRRGVARFSEVTQGWE
jgi:hypothetical protein